jgi:hypothetical protein
MSEKELLKNKIGEGKWLVIYKFGGASRDKALHKRVRKAIERSKLKELGTGVCIGDDFDSAEFLTEAIREEGLDAWLFLAIEVNIGKLRSQMLAQEATSGTQSKPQ